MQLLEKLVLWCFIWKFKPFHSQNKHSNFLTLQKFEQYANTSAETLIFTSQKGPKQDKWRHISTELTLI